MASKRKYNKRKIDGRYYNYFDICKMEGIPETRAKNAVKDKKVEGIKYLKELEPIEHLFEVFERPIKGGIVNSYGILRSYYDRWKQTGEVPKLPTGRPPKEGMKETKYYLPEDVRERFNRVVDNANKMSVIKVSYSDMAAVALKEFCDRRVQFLDEEDK